MFGGGRRVTGVWRAGSRVSDKSMLAQPLRKVAAHKSSQVEYPRWCQGVMKRKAPYTSRSGLYQFAMPLNTHQRTYTQTERDKGCAAITHKGQWHTDDWQDPAHHTHIHKDIGEY